MNKNSLINLNFIKDYYWSSDDFFNLITIHKQEFQISYLDSEENWASILLNKNLIGFVWKKYPLIIILDKYYNEIYSMLKEFKQLKIISVKSLQDKVFKIDDQLKPDLDFEENDKILSAEEIWFYTV